MRGWSFDLGLITDAGNEAVIAEILVEDSRGVFEGRLIRMISMREPVFTDLGLYLVGSLIICVRLRASSFDCRMAEVLSMSQFRSPSSMSSEDRWGQSIHICCPGHSWGQKVVYSKWQR